MTPVIVRGDVGFQVDAGNYLRTSLRTVTSRINDASVEYARLLIYAREDSYVRAHPVARSRNVCWIELATSDQAGAKSFYTSLFGWTAEDSPMGPGAFYTMFRLGGKDIGGGYTLMPDQVAMHVPPNWLVYVAVENADAADREGESNWAATSWQVLST